MRTTEEKKGLVSNGSRMINSQRDIDSHKNKSNSRCDSSSKAEIVAMK